MSIIYSFIAASAAMVGALIIVTFHKWSEKNSFLIINFAAGIMLTLAFINLIPTGFEFNSSIMIYVLIGFLSMFFLQFVVLFHPCHDYKCSKHTDIISIAGLSLHSLIDGLMIAIGFEANSNLGILTTLAILFHKLPDGITISGILLHNKASNKKILKSSLLTAGFTPLGTVSGTLLFKNIPISPLALGAFLGITAGSFIFLAASDLIPETHKSTNRTTALMLFIGVIVILVTNIL
ncbi:MAG: ZIP family metal transporter [Endomicrobium sp.]|jgi:ZIP family zinc transporter/zinc and cadmium transporter|nr:ZIP family metal transporter [Endomicrobium sp.]